MKTVVIPTLPTDEILYNMALRYRHDFWLDKDETSILSCGCTGDERRAILTTMRQLYDEIVLQAGNFNSK